MSDSEKLDLLHEKIDKLSLLMANLINNVEVLKENFEMLKNNMVVREEVTEKKVKKINIKGIYDEDYSSIIEDKIIKRHLEMKPPNSELKLFKKIYKKGTLCPIKIKKNKVIYYHNGKDWVDDETGEKFLKIFLNNVSKTYIKHNKLDDCNQNYQKFLDQQGHILKLREDKTIKKLLSNIIKEYK